MAIKIKVVTGLVILASLVFVAGCSTVPVTGGGPADAVKKSVEKFELPIRPPNPAEIDRFAQCMAPLSAQIKDRFFELIKEGFSSDFSPSGLRSYSLLSESIDEMVGHGVFAKLDGLRKAKDIVSDTITENDSDSVEPTDDGPKSSLQSKTLFQRLATEVPIPGKNSEFAKKLEAANRKFLEDLKSGVSRDHTHLKKASERSEKYLKAYFGNGATLTILDEDTKFRLQSKIGSALKIDADDSRVTNLLDVLLGEMRGTPGGADRIGMMSPGFVARDGTRYGFPGVFGDNAGGAIDHNQIGADVIRILLESLRDSYAPLPVLAGSTPAGLSTLGPTDIFGSDSTPDDDKQKGIWHIDGSHEYHYEITRGEFQAFESNARSTEASVAEAVGKAIRGGSSGSLNNEAVAKFIETAAGVIARQSTERAQWCLSYSQSLADSGG